MTLYVETEVLRPVGAMPGRTGASAPARMRAEEIRRVPASAGDFVRRVNCISY
jgi:hypothetical protein